MEIQQREVKMNGIQVIITLLMLIFAIIICIAAAHKEEIWSYIIFEDEKDYKDYEDDDLDEYYEQFFYLRVRNPFQT